PVELEAPRGAEPRVAQRGLAEDAVVLEAIAERAAADDAEALAPEAVLLAAPPRLFEDDEAVGRAAHPVELGLPRRAARDEALEDVARPGIGDVDAHVVPARQEAHVEVAQVVVVSHAEDSHSGTDSLSRRARRGRRGGGARRVEGERDGAVSRAVSLY